MARETVNVRGWERREVMRTVERLQWFSDNDVPALRALAALSQQGVQLPREEERRLAERGLLTMDGRLLVLVHVLVFQGIVVVNGVPTLVA